MRIPMPGFLTLADSVDRIFVRCFEMIVAFRILSDMSRVLDTLLLHISRDPIMNLYTYLSVRFKPSFIPLAPSDDEVVHSRHLRSPHNGHYRS